MWYCVCSDHLESLLADLSLLTLKKMVKRAWTGLIWLRIGTTGGIL
jgi:hypothetical protein